MKDQKPEVPKEINIEPVDLLEREPVVEKVAPKKPTSRPPLTKINWSEKSLFNGINGFIENHKKSLEELERLTQENGQLQLELNQSSSQISDLKEEIESYRTELARKGEVLERKEAKVSELENQIHQQILWSHERQLNLEKAKSLSKQLKQELANKEVTLKNVLNRSFKQKEEQIQLTEENESLNSEINHLKEKLTEQSLKIKELGNKNSELHDELSRLHDIISEKEEAYSALESELREQSEEFSQIKAERKSLLKDIANLTKDNEKLAQEVKLIRGDWEKLNSQYGAEKIKSLQLENQVSQLQEQITSAQKEIVELKDFSKSIQVNAQQIDLIETKYADLLDEKLRLEKELRELKESSEDLKIREGRSDLVREEMLERELKLNNYSRWVDSQKRSLQKHILRLAQEIKTSAAMNPLQSYLKLIEKEISRVEVLIVKSASFSAQKKSLEEQFEQLVKQRDDIKEILQESQAEAEKKSRKVLAMLKSEDMIPIPPLPPTDN